MSNTEIGYTLWQGRSRLENAPIAAIATLNTSNRKTGAMVQTWIIRTDISPVEAVNTARDSAICGACPHRGQKQQGEPSAARKHRTCYVNVGQAPNAVYKAYHRGRYPVLKGGDYADSKLAGRAIRFGAYGDPAAVPVSIWANLAAIATVRTGYTHQLNHKNFDPRILQYVMASADSPKQADKFNGKGARTFRVMNADDSLRPNEIECLADSEGMQCIDCGLCDGASDAPSVAITVHGSGAANFNTANVIARSI